MAEGTRAYLLTTHAAAFSSLELLTHDIKTKLADYLQKRSSESGSV